MHQAAETGTKQRKVANPQVKVQYKMGAATGTQKLLYWNRMINGQKDQYLLSNGVN